MLARRVARTWGFIVLGLALATAAGWVALPHPTLVEVGGLGAFANSVAACEDGIWIGTLDTPFRLRDGARLPFAAEIRARGAEVSSVGGALWVRDSGRDGATFAAVELGASGTPADPAPRPPVASDPVVGPRLGRFSPLATRAGFVAARDVDGTWLLDPERRWQVECVHPDGTSTLYVASGTRDPTRMRLVETYDALWIAAAFLGAITTSLARAADLAARRRWSWAAYFVGAVAAAGVGGPLVSRLVVSMLR
ncbi:MAG TPA: hypothetical protein VHF22_05135 [Planctomycetota bacterium]|nr:hypothetical protein [Planctomycetota bacterium]